MPFKTKLITAASALAIAVFLASSYTASAGAGDARSAGKSVPVSTYRSLDLFGDVFERVRADYVDPVEDRKLLEYALNGMLSNLDPHSAYMTEEETKAMSVQNRGEFGGLGIEVTMENGVVKVVSPIDETPAARAGVQSGDLIVEIDGQQVMGMSLNEAVDKMRGRVGTSINLTIVRSGAPEPVRVTLTRDIIQIKSVRARLESGNVGYIRMSAFNGQTYSGLQKAFEDLDKEAGNKLVGYVLDLRNNPGGLLDQAIAVSDAFLDKGEIVSTRGRKPEDTRRDNATPGDLARGLPVVVLINGGSASASEIVAGALQDHKRGIIMGTQSFGKGSVQTLLEVPGGGSIKLTTARYYTPSGNSIQGTGITPDIVVERAKIVEEKNAFGEVHEADLKGSLKNPNAQEKVSDPTLQPEDKKSEDGAKPGDKKADAKPAEKSDDYQLIRAIDVLQGIALYRTTGAPKP
ncbi:MAG: S41 family peptidase [Bdellovibrionales bacterium]|jgi:carboxyl-terminal processing protease|nr:S41 family peptidase [Bdellovibrionales bacterium]